MKTEYIPVSKHDNFLDILTNRLSYLESAEAFISNDLLAQLINSCTEVQHPNNNTYTLIWRNFDLPYKQSITLCLDNKSKWQKVSTINICNKIFVVDENNLKFRLYFLRK